MTWTTKIDHDDSISLEQDLMASPMMLANVRESHVYAQNLYAAMCNQEFVKNEVWPQLKGKTWSCSWRYAGGIIADMRDQGSYLDWYCSGIRNTTPIEQSEWDNLTLEEQTLYKEHQAYVAESIVTDEIRQDLFVLGWCVAET